MKRQLVPTMADARELFSCTQPTSDAEKAIMATTLRDLQTQPCFAVSGCFATVVNGFSTGSVLLQGIALLGTHKTAKGWHHCRVIAVDCTATYCLYDILVHTCAGCGRVCTRGPSQSQMESLGPVAAVFAYSSQCRQLHLSKLQSYKVYIGPADSIVTRYFPNWTVITDASQLCFD